MRGKLFKKLLAGVTTLAMAAQLAVVLPASAATNLYTEDFEGKQLTDLDYSLAGNTTARILTDIAGNETSFFNYYTSLATGNRASTYNLPQAYGAGKGVKFSMLMRMMGSNTNANEFAVRGSNGENLFNMTADSYLGNPAINGESVTLTTGKTGGVLGASDYESTGWLKFEAIVDFRSAPAVINLTVTDITNNNAVVYTERATTGATDIKTIYGSIGRSNGAFAFDDIIIDELDESELPQTNSYTVTYIVDGVESSEVVDENGYPVEVPAPSKTGYIFKGWQVGDDAGNVISSETLMATPVTDDVVYTAVFETDPEYIEAMESVEFSTLPSGNMLVAGPDADTAESNPIAVSITGEKGTDLLANPDPRVEDFEVKYELKGFRWIASENRASSDLEGTNTYCDGYGTFVVDDETHTADFQLRKHFFNYYGQIVATVTYNGKTITISQPLVFLGDTSSSSAADILPRGGYISDFGSYSPDMEGYIATVSPENRGATDIITDNWATYGGNSTRQLQLVNEDGSMFMRLTGTGGNSSCFAANQITAVTDSQVVFDQMVRFYNEGSSILWKTDNPVTWSNNATSFSVNFTGTEINIDGQKIADATTGVWYRLVVNSSVGSKQSYAMLYSEDGKLLGQSEIASFTNSGSVNPTFYMFRVPDRATNGMLDFNDVKIYRATVDQDTYTVTPASPTLSIPEEEGAEANTVSITASAKSTDGYDMISPVTWSIQDAPAGITITPGEDTHTAVLSVENGVSAGPVTVLATLNGITKSTEILLTTSSDSMSFLREYDGRTGLSPQSISIPLDASEKTVAEYKAAVVDKNFAIVNEDVTYRLIDSDGNNVSAEGVSFENGILTVTSDAKAMTVYVEATGQNSDGETLAMRYRVVIHGLSFDFGAGTDDDVAEGYTSVTPTTGYNETQGYGIEGAVTVGGTASTEDPTTDYFTGNFTFKANVEKNKIYKVTLNYTGNAAFENVSTDLSGVIRQNKERASIEYLTFVNDDVLDITFSDYIVRDNKTGEIIDQAADAIASIEIKKVEDKTPGAKPNIYTVGDSTIANNGSWAYNLSRDIAQYPELTEFATFSNNGRGGKNLSTYYTGGELWDRVVTQIRPGDYVMIGDMGTNGMGTDFKGSFNYYIDACLAMGAKVILNSYSPHMAVGDYANCYNPETHTFNGWRQDSYDNIVRDIYEERKSELAGFVEIGKNADASFNAYVADYAANGYSSADEAAQAIIACAGSRGEGPDHNHYSNGATAATLMIEGYGGVKGIVAQLVDILSADTSVETGASASYDGSQATVQFKGLDGTAAVIYVAEYNDDGTLKAVELKDVTVSGDDVTETVAYTAENAGNVKVFVWTDQMAKVPEL